MIRKSRGCADLRYLERMVLLLQVCAILLGLASICSAVKYNSLVNALYLIDGKIELVTQTEPPQASAAVLEEEALSQEDKPVTYNPDIPLSPELQGALQEACDAYQVPECLVLGLMEVESRFQAEADNGQCYGLMQLSKRYFPSNLSPAENIWAGVEYLGRCLRRYEGDTPAALCAYNAGHDTGYRGYANAVLAAAERWAESY